MKKELTKYDKTKEYNDEIMDLMVKLRIACNRAQIPMFCSVAIKNTDKITEYKNEMVGAASSGIMLKDDKIVKYVNVFNGFDTVPFKEEDIYDEI